MNMSSSDENEVFSENEVESIASNITYVKGSKSGTVDDSGTEGSATTTTTKSKTTTHPSYLTMIQETITRLAGGAGKNSGVSKMKICEDIKTTYGLQELSNSHIKKALKTAIEKEIIENSTDYREKQKRESSELIYWTGASGSFKLTKTYKEQLKKDENTKVKKEKAKKKEETVAAAAAAKAKKKEATKKVEPLKEKNTNSEKPSKVKKTSTKSKKATIENDSNKEEEEETKKVTKKPPAASKGKENKDAKKSVAVTTATTEIKEKIKEKINLKKAASTGTIKKVSEVEIPVPSIDVEMPKRRGRKAAK